jgi:hypothetical protein
MPLRFDIENLQKNPFFIEQFFSFSLYHLWPSYPMVTSLSELGWMPDTTK